jgi:choline dehydrogenase
LTLTPERDSYHDAIVVGAGSAGCALAARLSDAGADVLLVEAGSSYRTADAFPPAVLDGIVGGAASPDQPHIWPFVSALTGEISRPIPRGRILGGSSAVNGTYFVRGTKENFDDWARLGNRGWSYEDVLPYFIRLESDHDFTGSRFHGTDGPMPVSRHLDAPLHPVSAAFLEACHDLGFPDHPDKNAPGGPGFGRVPLNLVGGRRVNVAMAYILPRLTSPRLTVAADTVVRRVILNGHRAVGVEADRYGKPERIHAPLVVLAAGAINSPHLLMHSGVGPAEHLRGHRIDLVHDLPGVGRNLVDHPAVHVTFALNNPQPRGRTPMMQASLSFTTAGSDSPGDVEILSLLVAGGQRSRAGAEAPGDMILEILLQQEASRGDLSLASPDPAEHPVVRSRYLSEQADRNRLREGVKVAVDLLRSRSFAPIVRTITQPLPPDLASDDDLDRWIETHLTTAYHSTSTCRMGPENDPLAVVDGRCRVRGVEGLRVADASIMPYITSHGTAATALMIGERAADLMLAG